jgi:hypothetical protein
VVEEWFGITALDSSVPSRMTRAAVAYGNGGNDEPIMGLRSHYYC